MRKLLVLAAVLAAVVSIGVGGKASALPKLCSMSASYRAIYEYPTGSYWQSQIAAYPAYYAANDAYFQAKYGC